MRISLTGRPLVAGIRTSIWPLVLIVFLIAGQSAYWRAGTSWIDRALDDDAAAAALNFGGPHTHASDHGSIPASDAPAEIEHKLLHAMEHVQVLPSSVAPERAAFHAPLIGDVLVAGVVRRFPERSYRPPRARA